MITRLFLLLASLATASHAAETLVVVERNGVAVERAEGCWSSAGDRDDPFSRWLSSSKVACVPASSSIEFPPGLWNVFARTADALSLPLLVDGSAPPESLALSLEPAATLAPLLPEGAAGVVYAPRRAAAFPVGPRTLVPAAEELWLFVLDEELTATALIPIAAIASGETRSVNATVGGPPAVVGWLSVPAEERAALEREVGLAPPQVRAVWQEAARDADPLPPFARMHGAFIRVRDPIAGKGTLVAGGRGWVPDRSAFDAQSPLALVRAPLTLHASGTLTVYWSAQDRFAELEASLGACERSRRFPRVEIVVSRCARPERAIDPPDPASCSAIREELFDSHPPFGSFTLEDLLPGFYRAEFRYGKLPRVSASGAVARLKQSELRLQPRYFEAFGSLTQGGKPIEDDAVLIEFPSGYGFAPRGSGEYRAALLAPFGVDAKIGVAACQGEPRAVVLADEPMRPPSRYDIDVPVNELTIAVVDTFTREPLAGASVEVAVMSKVRLPRVVMEQTLKTTATPRGATVVLEAVPARPIVLTVSHAGYEKQVVPRFSMEKSGTKFVEVQLVPLRGSRGKIVSPVPFEKATVFWFSRDGWESESAEVAPDGTFVYSRRHESDETMAVVSLSHPLWVLRAPAADARGTMSLRFPDAPSRAFDVVFATTPPGGRYAGLAVGGIVLPHPALRQHQSLRRSSTIVRAATPLRIAGILESGPIEVILGPGVDEVPLRATRMNLFALEPYASAPRKRLGSGITEVRFEVQP